MLAADDVPLVCDPARPLDFYSMNLSVAVPSLAINAPCDPAKIEPKIVLLLPAPAA